MQKVSPEKEQKSKRGNICGKLTIRSAQPSDASVVSHLMYYSDPNLARYLFGEMKSTVIKAFFELFKIPRHVFSYTQAFVAECNGKIGGSFFVFNGKAKRALEFGLIKLGLGWFKIVGFRRIPNIIQAIIDLEKITLPILSNDCYIYMFAVLPERRGLGIGRQLIKFAETQAQLDRLKRIVLDVEFENKNARHFYEHLGYKMSGISFNLGFFSRSGIKGVVRMVKTLNAT